MPDSVRELLNGMPIEAISSALMAAFLSALRILGDKHANKLQRIFIEAPTAGCIGLTAMMTAVELGMGPWSAGFIACMVGHLGTEYVRSLARRLIEKKTGVKNDS